MLNQSRSCLFYSFWGNKFVFREWIRMLGKVKVTVVSLLQTHHLGHYSKLFHKIMFYRKCLANLLGVFSFSLCRVFLLVKETIKSFFSRKTMISIKSAQFQNISSFEQFFILFLHIFLHIVPFFSFG